MTTTTTSIPTSEVVNLDGDIIKVISDIHLGMMDDADPNKSFGDADMLAFLKKTVASCSSLVLLGDIFDLWEKDISAGVTNAANYAKIKSKRPKTVAYIETEPKIVYIVGNHDGEIYSGSPIDSLPIANSSSTDLTNIKAKAINDLISTYGNITIRFSHGHLGDEFNTKYKEGASCLSCIYGCCQRTGGEAMEDKLDTVMSQVNSGTKCTESTRAWALSQPQDIICCGHTHYAEFLKADGKLYLNDGCCKYPSISMITLNASPNNVAARVETFDLKAGTSILIGTDVVTK